jgi:hypothetical protein
MGIRLAGAVALLALLLLRAAPSAAAPAQTLTLAKPATASVDDLYGVYGGHMQAELQRLRANLAQDVFVIFGTNFGYVQCATNRATDGLYCEAQSAQSWPALASVLTPERIARLHQLGYADPGPSPNYAKIYPLAGADVAAVTRELIAILHDVYGYQGAPDLSVTRETDVVATSEAAPAASDAPLAVRAGGAETPPGGANP